MPRIIRILLMLVVAIPVLGADKDKPPAGLPNIPEGARWTIYCTTFGGAGHMELAKRYKDQLASQTKLPDWYIVHNPDHSTLYYGYYREIDAKIDAKEAARATGDRKTMTELTNAQNGERLFRGVLLLPMDEADPVAPPEWNLAGAKGFWSLQVAAFRENARRKEAAIEAVRDLRKQGYEAYYFHGPTVSSVCLGAFPKSSVDGTYGQKNENPNAAVLVAPGDIPMAKVDKTDDGRPVITRQAQISIRDPKLAELWKQFPNHATNYVEGERVKTRDGKVVDKLERSFLVIIPNIETEAAAAAQQPRLPAAVLSQMGANPDLPPTVQANSTPQQPTPPRPVQPAKKPPQGGKLRGLDDY